MTKTELDKEVKPYFEAGADVYERLFASSEAVFTSLYENAMDDVRKSGCASYIEKMLAGAFVILASVNSRDYAYISTPKLTLKESIKRAAESKKWVCVFPQVRIAPYCVDFLIVHSYDLDSVGIMAIECDGHDFHEKTKEQAAHDSKRDRELQAEGVNVFRFTGSEIWRNPFECAESVLVIALGVAIDSEYARHCLRNGDIAEATKALSYVKKHAGAVT